MRCKAGVSSRAGSAIAPVADEGSDGESGVEDRRDEHGEQPAKADEREAADVKNYDSGEDEQGEVKHGALLVEGGARLIGVQVGHCAVASIASAAKLLGALT